MCKSILKGQNVPGTDGTYHGTDGTCPRDRRDAHQGVSRQNSLCLLVFFFPQLFRKGPCPVIFQKNPRVRKIRVRNSGAGNGCANFMDTWKKCVLSAGKTMSVKFPFFGGGFWGGGGGCRFYFYGRADFSEIFYGK